MLVQNSRLPVKEKKRDDSIYHSKKRRKCRDMLAELGNLGLSFEGSTIWQCFEPSLILTIPFNITSNFTRIHVYPRLKQTAIASYKIEKVIDRPTQTPLCGLTAATSKPLKFFSDECVLEQRVIYRPAGAGVQILKESLQLLCLDKSGCVLQ